MKWKMKEACYGDIVRVELGKIYHFGIFVSEDEVIQFGLPPTPGRRAEDVEVLAAPVSDFLAGGFLEVGCCEGNEKKRRRTAEQTVSVARSRLGERGYDIIHNNCEHFANECAFGERFSSMTENLRMKFRSIPVVHVYVEKFPFCIADETILPPERQKEIDSCSNPKVRSEKFYAWKLLEKALIHSLGLKLENLGVTRNKNGKWGCSSCYFSISHSGDLVAVAVSRKPVGVDIEKRDETRFTDALEDKIVSKREAAALQRLEERGTALNALWTKKEAIFKLDGEKSFQPKQIETSKYTSTTKSIQCGEERYLITVASDDAEQAVFYCDGFEVYNDVF